MAELPSGSVFAGYRIEEVAGRGGMGVVYRASDLSLDRSVALKVIAPAFAADDAFRRRFRTESKVAASIDHPNVIPIYQAGEHDEVLFLVMRYVDGRDLRSLIAEHGRLRPERAASIAAQIGSALDAAHEIGLVHRDVKPANALITASDHVYLTDFGLTKRLVPEDDPTMTGTLLGTLNYVAPEQIRGDGVGAHTDVYALGCVLFQLLTGRVPFPLENEESKLWAHLSEPAPAPSKVCPDVPEAFDSVVRRAMSKHPEDRYPSAGDLGGAAMAANIPASFSGEGPKTEPTAEPSRAPLSATAAPHPPAGPPSPRALIRRAMLDPFGLVLLLGVLVAAAVIGAVVLVPAAVALYAASAARAYYDGDVRATVAERAVAVEASPILELVGEALDRNDLIRAEIDEAEAPSAEISEELDRFEGTIRRTAARAQLLRDEMDEVSGQAIATRIEELERENDPTNARLIGTLSRQLAVRRRMEAQMHRFYEEMSQTLDELDGVREHVQSAQASEGDATNEVLVAEVREIRQGISKVGDHLAAVRRGQEGFDAFG